MASNNTFILKIPFKSNRPDIAKFSGYVLYSFIEGELNSQKWIVRNTTGKVPKGEYKSISAISKEIKKGIAITGACAKRESGLVIIDDESISGKYFYPILTRVQINQCNDIPKTEKIIKGINWEDDFIGLEEALKRLPRFKEKFDEYNK